MKKGMHTMKDQSLYTRLADEIFNYIKRNHIKNGERIPSERKLAELFSSSRATVREAIRILENKGIIEIQIGNGMYLREDLNQDLYRIELWKTDYMEILEVKMLLEGKIIKELCNYLPIENLLGIEEALGKLEQGYEYGIFDLEADHLFHRRLRQCSHNKTLIQLADNLTVKLDEYGNRIDPTRKIWFDTIPLHREMMNGIRNHDYQKAWEAYMMIYDMDKKILRGKG